MVAIKDTDIDMVYGVLQQWINYNDDNGIAAVVLSLCGFHISRSTIRHHGIKITSDDVKKTMNFLKNKKKNFIHCKSKRLK